MPRVSLTALVFAVFFSPALACAQSTYYIDFVSGSDSNNGTAKGTPWKHHPYMSGWAGSYSHSSGDHFIFKGGVTWPRTTGTALPLVAAAGGTSGNNDYYGVDATWYTGGSWTRPVFDDEYTDGDQATFDVRNRSYITIDNLEIKNMLASMTNYNFSLVYGYNASNITIQNCYLHDWWNTGANDQTKHGGVFGISSITLLNNTISNNAHPNNGLAVSDSNGTVSGNIIHDMPSAMVGVEGIISGNTIYNINWPVSDFDGAEHTNVIYSVSAGTTYMYNNVIHDTLAGVVMEGEPCWNGGNGTYYIYNNLVYNGSLNAGGGGMIDISNEGGSGSSCGTAYIYNNTTETQTTNGIRITGGQSSTPLANIVVQNNHNIGAGVEVDGVSPVSLTNTNNLLMSESTATSQGYVLGNQYAPTSGSDSTVGAGLNLTSSCAASRSSLCSDPLSVARPSSGAWDVGAYEFSRLISGVPSPPANLTATSH
jgi:hypothetical protein